jgi:hypothetical protein
MNLRDELNLRRRLFSMPRDEIEYLSVGSGDDERCYRVDRLTSNFRLTTLDGTTLGLFPKRKGMATDFHRYRAVADVLAAVYGAAIAPELVYQNIVRIGARFAAYCFSNGRGRIVLYADTAQDAAEEYAAWDSVREDNFYKGQWANRGRYTREAA